MHPLLIPGAHVLRRGPAQVQVGLDPEQSVVAGLGSGSGPVHGVPPGAELLPPAALQTLVREGLAWADDRPVRQVLPAGISAAWPRHTLAALTREPRPDLDSVMESRRSHVVHVQTFGRVLVDDLADDLRRLCVRAGLALPAPKRPGPPPRRARQHTPVVVLLGVGEPSREVVDPLLRDSVPHLVVRLAEGRAVLGPFVEPGRTACLRCIDAHHTEEDPAWPLLVEQYARATRSDRPDGIPEPVDAALAAIAVGWAVRDIASYAEQAMPATLSSTIRLSPRLETIETRTWPGHPTCGCGWD